MYLDNFFLCVYKNKNFVNAIVLAQCLKACLGHDLGESLASAAEVLLSKLKKIFDIIEIKLNSKKTYIQLFLIVAEYLQKFFFFQNCRLPPITLISHPKTWFYLQYNCIIFANYIVRCWEDIHSYLIRFLICSNFINQLYIF